MLGKGQIKKMALAALLTALSVLIGFVCKYYFTFGAIRITFDNLPVILAGMLLGPVYGGVVGAAADLVTAPVTGSVNPFITLGAAAVGVVSGVLFRYFVKGRGYASVLLGVLPAHILGSMVIKSFGLWYFYGYALSLCLLRIPVYLGISLAEAYIIYIIYKNKGVSSQIERMLK